MRKETANAQNHATMIENLVKLDRGELAPSDAQFTEATDLAKKYGSKAISHVTEEHETAQKRVELARASVIKMRGQLQAIATTSKSNALHGNDVFMKNNR